MLVLIKNCDTCCFMAFSHLQEGAPSDNCMSTLICHHHGSPYDGHFAGYLPQYVTTDKQHESTSERNAFGMLQTLFNDNHGPKLVTLVTDHYTITKVWWLRILVALGKMAKVPFGSSLILL